MLGIIYIITNSINSRVYIGQTIRTLHLRWLEHCRKGSHGNDKNMAIKRAILKYGKDKFQIKELEKCAIEELNEKEIYYISLYNSYKDGYNNTIGGSNSPTREIKLKDNQKEVVQLYQLGFSLRDIATEFNVDKATIKHIIENSNVALRTTRTYKLSQADREDIIKDTLTMSRKEIINKWGISKSYLSQLINGKRRI